jgi:hypothetical protein
VSKDQEAGDFDFEQEHAKRDRHTSDEQGRCWSAGLLASLPESKAYQAYCTPEARLREQEAQLKILEEWCSRLNGSTARCDAKKFAD